jgi:hypothetical protein
MFGMEGSFQELVSSIGAAKMHGSTGVEWPASSVSPANLCLSLWCGPPTQRAVACNDQANLKGGRHVKVGQPAKT